MPGEEEGLCEVILLSMDPSQHGLLMCLRATIPVISPTHWDAWSCSKISSPSHPWCPTIGWHCHGNPHGYWNYLDNCSKSGTCQPKPRMPMDLPPCTLSRVHSLISDPWRAMVTLSISNTLHTPAFLRNRHWVITEMPTHKANEAMVQTQKRLYQHPGLMGDES